MLWRRRGLPGGPAFHPEIHGKMERCQRRPACAMPYTGFSTRHRRSTPSVSCMGTRWMEPSGRDTVE